MLVYFMDFIILAIPLFIGVIMSKRYNIFFGLLSCFTSAFFFYFLLMDSGLINKTFLESFSGNCLVLGLENMRSALVVPFMNVSERLFQLLHLDAFYSWLISNNWFYFSYIFLLNLVFQIISSLFRARRVKNLKQLKKDARR